MTAWPWTHARRGIVFRIMPRPSAILSTMPVFETRLRDIAAELDRSERDQATGVSRATQQLMHLLGDALAHRVEQCWRPLPDHPDVEFLPTGWFRDTGTGRLLPVHMHQGSPHIRLQIVQKDGSPRRVRIRLSQLLPPGTVPISREQLREEVEEGLSARLDLECENEASAIHSFVKDHGPIPLEAVCSHFEAHGFAHTLEDLVDDLVESGRLVVSEHVGDGDLMLEAHPESVIDEA